MYLANSLLTVLHLMLELRPIGVPHIVAVDERRAHEVGFHGDMNLDAAALGEPDPRLATGTLPGVLVVHPTAAAGHHVDAVDADLRRAVHDRERDLKTDRVGE